METERIAWSQRERDRLRVLREVKRKQLTQSEAATRLKISDSTVVGGTAEARRPRGGPWTKRKAIEPEIPRTFRAADAHRRLDPQQRLEEILSVRVGRRVADDHSVSWDGTRWGVKREEVCAGLRGAQVEVERRLDGSHWLRFRGRYLRLRHCPAPLRPSARAKPKDKIKPRYHVPAEHPSRKPWNRTFLSCEKPDISTLR